MVEVLWVWGLGTVGGTGLEYYCIQKHIGTRHTAGNKGLFFVSLFLSPFCAYRLLLRGCPNILKSCEFLVFKVM
jgi:hypothetical protein